MDKAENHKSSNKSRNVKILDYAFRFKVSSIFRLLTYINDTYYCFKWFWFNLVEQLIHVHIVILLWTKRKIINRVINLKKKRFLPLVDY